MTDAKFHERHHNPYNTNSESGVSYGCGLNGGDSGDGYGDGAHGDVDGDGRGSWGFDGNGRSSPIHTKCLFNPDPDSFMSAVIYATIMERRCTETDSSTL